MHYLMIDQDQKCKWCMNPWLQIFEDKDPKRTKIEETPVVRLCPNCDRWPKELIDYGYV